MVIALQLIIFALGFDLCLGRDDTQHRQGLHIVTLTATRLSLGPDLLQPQPNFLRVGLGNEDQFSVFGGELTTAP
ncbi:hypothetical protein D3C76_1643520 [compost metagenome]